MGSTWDRAPSQTGRFFIGKKAPLKKNSGATVKLNTMLNPSRVLRRDAIATPTPTKPRDIIIINGNEIKIEILIFIPRSMKRSSITIDCVVAIVAPPNDFPKTIESLDTGATSISLKNPCSLSQITEMPERTEVNSRGIATIPGAKKSAKFISNPLNCIEDANPVPKIMNQKNGMAIELTNFSFSLTYPSISLSHTV